jgi:hypothetical protein
MDNPASLDKELLIGKPDLEGAFEDVNHLRLPVMDVKRASTLRPKHGFAEIVGTPGLIACQFMGDTQVG